MLSGLGREALNLISTSDCPDKTDRIRQRLLKPVVTRQFYEIENGSLSAQTDTQNTSKIPKAAHKVCWLDYRMALGVTEKALALG